MQVDLPEGLKKADMSDWKTLADITADAFSEDPVMRWMFGNPRAIQSALRVLARSVYVPLGESYLFEDKGAAMWLPWGADNSPSKLNLVQFAIGQARFGAKGALKRAMTAGEVMEKNHPTERHYYLFTIGSTSAARGQGVGKSLLRPMLEACDREAMPVYLENSNPVNSGFYRAHGFERMAEPFQLAEGSPVMEPMWRAPQ